MPRLSCCIFPGRFVILVRAYTLVLKKILYMRNLAYIFSIVSNRLKGKGIVLPGCTVVAFFELSNLFNESERRMKNN